MPPVLPRIQEAQQKLLKEALSKGLNIKQTAEYVGVARPTIYRMIKRLNTTEYEECMKNRL